jgi:CRISPR system Cascade subunit CasE
MILSRVALPHNDLGRTADLLGDGLYGEHQLLWQLFPDEPDASRDFLYRRESDGDMAFFYLLSQRQPQAGETGLRLQSKPFHPQLVAGDRLRFELRANAVRTTHDGSGSKRRRRRDIVEAALDTHRKNSDVLPHSEEIRQQAGTEWLRAQGERGGFTPLTVRVSNHQFVRLRKPGSKTPIHFAHMDYAGVLEVTNADVFVQQTVKQGLGRSRSFGCGLMMLSRA